jgi:hexosaminidase
VADIAPDERYSLTIDRHQIIVRSAEETGAARGLTTLLQLLATATPDTGGAIALPAMHVVDAPRFAWRGLSLDVVRTCFAVSDIQRVIDLLALYKFNVLHLHLTNDEAWRIAPGRPAAPASADDAFYTNAELEDLAAYAHDRFVKIVPEIDTPGHGSALLQMHPDLSNGRNVMAFELFPGRIQRSTWLDPDLPKTFAVLDDVLGQVASIFPGRFMHIGGDEAFGMPDDLYVRFVRHVCAQVRSLGKRTIGWQESIRAYAEPDHVIQYWIGSTTVDASLPKRTPDGSSSVIADNAAKSRSDIVRAMERHVPILVSPVRHAYFDVPYAEPSVDPSQEGMRQRVGLPFYPPRTVAQAFDWEPIATLGLDAGPQHLAGVSAAVWTETIKNFTELTFMLLPRLAGVAHKAWSDVDAMSWDEHRRRLAAHRRLWAQDGFTYFKSSALRWAPDKATV